MSAKPNRSAGEAALAAGRSSGFEWLVQAGFVGLVYTVIGGLALALALGPATVRPPTSRARSA